MDSEKRECAGCLNTLQDSEQGYYIDGLLYCDQCGIEYYDEDEIFL